MLAFLHLKDARIELLCKPSLLPNGARNRDVPLPASCACLIETETCTISVGFFSFPALPERFSASRQLIRHSADRLLSNFEGGVSALKLSRLSCPKWSFEAFGCFLRGIGAECRAECRAEPVAPGPKAPGPSPGRPLGRWAGAGRRPRRAPRAPGPEPPRQRLRGRRGRGGESEPGAMAGGVGGGGACESCPPWLWVWAPGGSVVVFGVWNLAIFVAT